MLQFNNQEYLKKIVTQDHWQNSIPKVTMALFMKNTKNIFTKNGFDRREEKALTIFKGGK
jgi:hypothetical protein